jgi:hypothetical protein
LVIFVPWWVAKFLKLTLIGQHQTTKTPRSPRQIKEQQSQMAKPLTSVVHLLPGPMPSNAFLVFFVPWWFISYLGPCLPMPSWCSLCLGGSSFAWAHAFPLGVLCALVVHLFVHIGANAYGALSLAHEVPPFLRSILIRRPSW